MKIFVIFIILFSTSFSSLYAESYSCTVENSAGLKYSEKEKKWENINYNDGEKYKIIKDKKKYYTEKYVIVNDKEPLPLFYCIDDFNKNGILACESNGIFKFNKNSMRFIATFEFGYIEGTDNQRSSLVIFIGECSNL